MPDLNSEGVIKLSAWRKQHVLVTVGLATVVLTARIEPPLRGRGRKIGQHTELQKDSSIMDTIPTITAFGDARPIERRYPHRLQYFIDHAFKSRNEIEVFLNKLIVGNTVSDAEPFFSLLPNNGKVLVVCTLRQPVGILVWVAIGFASKEDCDAFATRFSDLYSGIKYERFDNYLVGPRFDFVFQRIPAVLREIRVNISELGGAPEMTHQTELGSLVHDPIGGSIKVVPGKQ